MASRRGRVASFIGSAYSRPGAVVLVMVAVYAGLAGLFHIGTSTDVLETLLPSWLTVAFNVIYAVGGVAMFVGMGAKRGNWEAAGWILLAVSSLIRGIAVVVVVGLSASVVGLLVLYLGFLIAALVRIGQIVRGDSIVVVHVVREES